MIYRVKLECLYLFYPYMCVSPVEMYVYHISAWCLGRSERGIKSLELALGTIVSH